MTDATFDERVERVGKASRSAAVLSLAGFLVIVAAMAFALVSLRRLEAESAILQAKVDGLHTELRVGAQQRDSLRVTISQTRHALASARAAINAFHAGRLEDAAQLYAEALAADPGNAYVQNLQAYTFFKLKRLPEAISAQRKSLAADTSYAWGYFDLARFLCASGVDSLSSARVATERAIRLRPDMRPIMRSDGEFQRVCGYRLP